MKSVLVVGASLAGLEAARVLRLEGYDGRLTVVGDEPHLPYDRPPLSKGFLNDTVGPDELALPFDGDSVDLRTGTHVERLLAEERAVLTSAGDRITADALIVATGARARQLPTPFGPTAGVHTLRSLDDGVALRADLIPGSDLVVVGGGFIGCEVAATAVALGLSVTIVEPQSQLLGVQLGPSLASFLADTHIQRGVRIICGVGVDEIRGDQRVRSVRLTDGTEIPADVILVGIGSEPTAQWLQGSGVGIQNGVLCDEFGRTDVPGVIAVGDCAAWRGPDGRHHRRQHWTAALRQAAVGVTALMGREQALPGDVDYVWSDQYDLRLQVFGRLEPGLRCSPISGSPGIPPFTVAYHGGDSIVRAVASVNEPRVFGKWKRLVGTARQELSSVG